MFFFAALIVFAYMTFWFILSRNLKRNDIADVAWGLGFVTLALSTFLINNNFFPRQFLASFLVALWGGRLSLHIFLRNRKKKEDRRYQEMQKNWGKWFVLRSYLQVFLLQGLFMFIISAGFVYINSVQIDNGIRVQDLLGLLIWLVGFIFESVGDYQLSKHLENPKNKGKLMTSGLWSRTRHPNYFGEVTEWWGIWIMTLSLPLGYLTIISPLMISFLILKVSGIPLLEKKYEGRSDFEEYKKSVPVFFPKLIGK